MINTTNYIMAGVALGLLCARGVVDTAAFFLAPGLLLVIAGASTFCCALFWYFSHVQLKK